MRKVSGDLHIVDFKTKQIIASLQPEDYLDDLRHWEIKDNVDILDFKLLEDSPFLNYIQQKNLILKETNPGVITPYVITSIEKDSEAHNVTIYASGEWILLDKENYIKPQEIKSWSAEQYLTLGIKGTEWEIGLMEAEGKRSFKIEKFISPLQFIQQIATLFDNIEIQYRIEIGTGKPRRFIDLVKKRGRETNKEVTLGKDLVGIKRIENSENIITALVPYYIGQDADGNDKLITIESVNSGSQYIVDDAAFQRWNVNGKHLFGFYTPESEKDELTPARLLTLAKTELKKRVSAIITYEVNSIDISSVFGYEHEDVSEGDTIRIIDEGMTPTLYLEARAIAGDESHKDKHRNKHTFGNYVEIVNQDEALRKLYQKMLSMINDKVSKEWFSALEEKANDAAKKANEAVEESQSAKDLANATKDYMDQNMVDIIEQPTAPTENLRDGKTLWIDSSDPENKVQKLWKGGQWQRVTPDTGPLKQSIKDVQKDIETTKMELNQKVQEAQNQTTGQFNEVKESLQSVSRTISDVQNEQGNINKKVTQIEQTSDGFKTSIESLTKKDGEISNKLSTVESTVEGTKKTISDVQQTTNDLKKTTTEIEEKAGKITEKLTSLETREVNVRNYASNSDFSNDKNGWTGITNAVTTKIVDVTVPSIPEIKKGLQLTSNSAFVTQILQTEPFINKKGVASCYVDVKTVTSTSEYPRLYMRFTYDQNGKDQNYYAIFPQKEVTNGWKRISVKFDTTKYTGTLKEVRVNVATANTTTVDATFTGIMVTFGDLLESWNLAPEDGVTQGAFQSKTTEIEKSVDGVTTTVSTVQKEQGTMQSSLNQVKQTADSNSQTITSLSQTQGKHGEIIQQNTSDITQLNNQIKSKVSDTQMQDYVGGLGSTNIIMNAAFEKREIHPTSGTIIKRTPSFDKWIVPAGVTVDVARHHDGFSSAKIEKTGQTDPVYTGINQIIPVTSRSGVYVYSAWFYTDNKSLFEGQSGVIKMQLWNGNTALDHVQTELEPLLVNGSWVFASVKLGMPNKDVTHIRAEIWVRKNGRMWVSQPMLQQGSTPSTFMENPKDIGNYDALVGEVAKKVATSDFNSKVTQMETTINQQSNRIDLKAEKNDVYNKVDSDGRYGSKSIVESHTAQLSVMSNEINLRVKSGDVASTINQTAQSVLIQADKIYLNGYIEAKHLKAQTLQGVTIQTAPAGSGANQIRLNAQNLTVYGGGRSRGYLGFIERTDGNVQSALILGNDYETSGTLNGSLVIDQTTINSNVFTNSVASIGIATGRNGNDVIKSSYINFYRYDGAMQINSVGDMSLTNTNGNVSLTASSTGGTTGFINLSASKDIYFTSKRGYFNFYTSDDKSFPALTIKDIAPTNQGNVDFTFANQIMLRVSRHPDYVGDGLQIRNATGDAYRDIRLRTLRATENISAAQGKMYALEFVPMSTRKIKTNIEDLPFSALEKVNSVKIKQYNLIADVEKYNAGEIDVLPVNYGMIAEDSDRVFTTPVKDAITLYSSVSITMQSVQELDWKTDNMQFDIGMLKQELEAEKPEKVYIENQLSELKVLVNSQEDRIAKLEELLLQQLINEKPEQP
ncbi:phage tail spike protein [Bacillus wiedmannii]|uniref:phage tail spike protein n=1 Tax=Bacillus wiedmannii TaxID=1890302 RepID=UPI001F0972DE|nr:phage tail spike protein [Bacillus wiedmannii]MCX3317272.1 tail fiber domain-containing protein [Bacillus wiedmannii]